MFERGLAYRQAVDRELVPELPNRARQRAGRRRRLLALRHRSSSTRDLEQWFFRITHYADELLDGHRPADGLAREGPDDAAELDRAVGRRPREVPAAAGRRQHAADGPRPADATDIEVFTTRIDTIYGATFVLLAPEHRSSSGSPTSRRDPAAFREQVQRFRAQDRTARLTGEIEKEGFFTGRYAVNPFTGEPVPIWVANFVLGEYGTGAVMAVPAHDQRDFEFARKYGLPITVVDPARGEARRRCRPDTMTEAYVEPRPRSSNSGEFNGLLVDRRDRRR